MDDVLVTGATGLIGQHLVKDLARDHRVHALARRPGPDLTGVTWHVGDLADPLLMQRLPGVKAVIHLAQSRHFRDFPSQAVDIFEINVASTARLLDWASAHGVKSFVQASSGGVYGHGDHGFREDDHQLPAEPLGFYLASKRSAELLLESYESLFQSTTVLRFFFVYGRGQNSDMLVPRLVRMVRDRTPIVLQGPDGLRMNPVYVSDAVRAVRAAMSLSGHHHVNVAGPEVLSLREIGEVIGRVVGSRPEFAQHLDEQPRHLIGEITKMEKLLARPVVPFEQGVKSVCEEIRAF